MGVIIKPGTTEEAKRELWSFTNAFTAMEFSCLDNGNVIWYVFDESDAALYEDMENNQLIGTLTADEIAEMD